VKEQLKTTHELMRLKGIESVKMLQEIEAINAAEKAFNAAFDEFKNWCLKKKKH
jgi:hypothetical protein